MELASLTDLEVETLNAFLGYGDFRKADIIFVMNEEGLGGIGENSVLSGKVKEQHEINIGYRMDEFGMDNNFYIDGNQKLSGFWEPGGVVTEKKIERYYKRKGWKYEKIIPKKSVPLQFLSRMVLALEDSPNNWEDWFLYAKENGKKWDRVVEFIGTGLFCEREGIKTALVDLRPIPRKTEEWKTGGKHGPWPYSGGVQEKQYLKIFSDGIVKNIDEKHQKLWRKRIGYLENLFFIAKAPVIFLPGARVIKCKIVRQILEQNNIKWKEMEDIIPNTEKPVIKFDAEFPNGRKQIFVTDFFDNRRGIGINGLKNLFPEIHKIVCGKHVSRKNQSSEIEVSSGPRGITNKQMIPEMKSAVDQKDKTRIVFLYKTYNKIFLSSMKYMGNKRKKEIESWLHN